MDRQKWAELEKLQRVIFVYDIQSRSLTVFASEAEAIAAIEGLAISEGDYKFFSADGSPLEAVFSIPARIHHDRNTYTNGVYTLKPCNQGEHFFSFLKIVECKDEAKSGLATLRDVEQFLIDLSLQKNKKSTLI